MGRPSSIKRLPEPIRLEVDRLVRAQWTIDEICAELAKLTESPVSRSAMGRYVKDARESMAKFNQAQELSKMWLERFGSEPDSTVSRLLPQMLEAVAFNTIESMADAEKPTKAGEVMFMAKALKDITGSKRSVIDLNMKLAEIRANAKEAAKEVEETVRSAGLSEHQVQMIRTRILGIGEK